jgi:hypothetical protein
MLIKVFGKANASVYFLREREREREKKKDATSSKCGKTLRPDSRSSCRRLNYGSAKSSRYRNSSLGCQQWVIRSQVLSKETHAVQRLDVDGQIDQQICLRYSPVPWESLGSATGVTTHLPNELALKMDGAEANDLYSTISANAKR